MTPTSRFDEPQALLDSLRVALKSANELRNELVKLNVELEFYSAGIGSFLPNMVIGTIVETTKLT